MYCEWPELRRCCFFFPLRRGILFLAYFNIIFSILEVVTFSVDMPSLTVHRSYSELPFQLNIILFVLDGAATVVLLVGLHMKKEVLVRIYFNFMVFTLSSSVLLTIIDISLMDYAHQMLFTAFYFIFTSAFNIYLVVMVRSMLKKLQVSDGNTFENRLTDFLEGREPEADQNHTVAITISSKTNEDE